MLSLLYSTVLLYYICFCFVLSCTLLIGGNKEILLLLLYEYSMTFYSVFVNLRKKCALDCCTITNLNEINHNSPIA